MLLKNKSPPNIRGILIVSMYYVIYGNFGIKTWPISKSLKDHIQQVETSKYHPVFALFFPAIFWCIIVGNHLKKRLSVTLWNFLLKIGKETAPELKIVSNCRQISSKTILFLEILGNIFLENRKTSMCVCVCIFSRKIWCNICWQQYIASCFKQDITSFCKMFVENSWNPRKFGK